MSKKTWSGIVGISGAILLALLAIFGYKPDPAQPPPAPPPPVTSVVPPVIGEKHYDGDIKMEIPSGEKHIFKNGIWVLVEEGKMQ